VYNYGDQVKIGMLSFGTGFGPGMSLPLAWLRSDRIHLLALSVFRPRQAILLGIRRYVFGPGRERGANESGRTGSTCSEYQQKRGSDRNATGIEASSPNRLDRMAQERFHIVRPVRIIVL